MSTLIRITQTPVNPSAPSVVVLDGINPGMKNDCISHANHALCQFINRNRLTEIATPAGEKRMATTTYGNDETYSFTIEEYDTDPSNSLRATVVSLKQDEAILLEEFKNWDAAHWAQVDADAPLNLTSPSDEEIRLLRSGDDCLVRLNAVRQELKIAINALIDSQNGKAA